MKREEFKLLIENWRKNFIVESPEHDPHGVQHDIGSDDYDYFHGDDMSSSHEDEDLLSNLDSLQDLENGEFDHSMPSYDTLNRDDNSFEDRGIYDDDPPTEDYEDSNEFGHMPMPDANISYEDDYEDEYDREIDEAIDEAIDEEFKDDEYGF